MIIVETHRNEAKHQRVYTITIDDAIWSRLHPNEASKVKEETEVAGNPTASALLHLGALLSMEKLKTSRPQPPINKDEIEHET